MTPIQRYEQDLLHSGFEADSAQRKAVEVLDKLYHEMIEHNSHVNKEVKIAPVPKWKMKILTLLGQSSAKVDTEVAFPQGVYFWGGVGRGKTYLMDSFYDSLPIDRKIRCHFHRFMYRVHDELSQLKEVSDPLEVVADKLHEEALVICFDEFFVSDITDAMILGTLFQALFKRGVTLVATSNIPPENLYRNGLQRARFLPAIALIQKHCHVLNVDSGVDYRLRTLEQAEIYHSPLDEKANQNLLTYFKQLVNAEHTAERIIDINHRQLPIIASADGVLHATFEQLCQSARSQNDYIELSKLYHTVLLADVQQMGGAIDDAARRFIALVDEFYERNVTLIISANVPLDDLYTEGQLNFEFKRCQSRLTEMQSHDYLEREHLG
ncbi:cell division protein ZapE [Vibrio sp.]|nr:cell division protein ZapE [Vibrio sp.]